MPLDVIGLLHFFTVGY